MPSHIGVSRARARGAAAHNARTPAPPPPSRRSAMSGIGTGYDLDNTTFSPDGRLFQVRARAPRRAAARPWHAMRGSMRAPVRSLPGAGALAKIYAAALY